jgi:small-conductance mechanosensitive channel
VSKIKLLLLFIAVQTMLIGADINKTITYGDIKVYSELEQNLDKGQPKDVLDLQKTLLNKLKNLSSKRYLDKNRTINYELYHIKDQKEYKKAFEKYLLKILEKDDYSKKLLKNQKNLASLKKQIDDDNSFNLTKQLFYAYYHKQIEIINSKIALINNQFEIYSKSFIDAIYKIKFSNEKNIKISDSYKKNLKSIKEKESRIKLKIEQSKLVDNNRSVEIFTKQLKQIRDKRQDLIHKKLVYDFLIFSKLLQDKDEKVFANENSIYKFIENNYPNRYEVLEDNLSQLFKAMKKEILGLIKTIEGESVEDIKDQLLDIWNFINRPIFNINNTPISIFKIIIAIIIFIIGFFFSKAYKHYIRKLASRSKNMSESTETLLINLGHYFIFVITFFIALNVLGIDLSSIALVAGALSVGIGFGLQNIISNFVSGIILMVERSIRIGDYIQVDDNTKGRVIDIRMRSIIVNTTSNIDIIIPNQSLVENRVVNWSMNDKIRRFEIPFGVAYGTSPEKVIQIVLDAIEKSDCKAIFTSENRKTKVVMTEMADSSINFELFIWIAGKEIFYPKSVTSKFLILIYNALNENNIEIPFPQQDIHIRSMDNSILSNLK